ncbi:MAG: response regulator [Pseudomonadota bacterium]|nr:response regulator [Pseudomonadota bacterium]
MTSQNLALADTEPAVTSLPQQFAYTMRAKIKRHQPLVILLAEDDPSDICLTECALDETYVSHQLHTVHNGSEVLQYLRCEGIFAGKPRPDLILLDLHLPYTDGFEVLETLAHEAGGNGIPIIILTGSEHYRHLLDSCNVWLCDYVAKPCSPDKLLGAFARLHSP